MATQIETSYRIIGKSNSFLLNEMFKSEISRITYNVNEWSLTILNTKTIFMEEEIIKLLEILKPQVNYLKSITGKNIQAQLLVRIITDPEDTTPIGLVSNYIIKQLIHLNCTFRIELK